MNIKDFLVDNYYWIIAIILITIITIIGFLADRKKNGKKKENTQVVPQQTNNVAPMQYEQPQNMPVQNQMNNNMNVEPTINDMNNQVSMQPINQPANNNMTANQPMAAQSLENQNLNINTNAQAPMNAPNFEQQNVGTIPTSVNMVTSPSAVENISQTVNPEPIYQPLSEQKPVIPPQPVPNYSNMINNPVVGKQPLENNNMTPNNSITQQVSNQYFNSQPQEQSQQIVNSNMNIPTPQIMQPIENNVNIPNFNQINTTIPEPISQVIMPQPVNPQHIIPTPDLYSNQQMMQNNYGAMPQSMPMPQQPIQEQPANVKEQQSIGGTPVSFVFGPQNNNQNM